MTKTTAKQPSKAANAIMRIMDIVSAGIATGFLVIAVMESTNTLTRFVGGLALVWLGGTVALFVFNFVIRPAAQTIMENS